ncbi:hypothetical protein Sjap_003925 [Stephania japonica]|uniref:Uncharacterized protein n=1 Tax=Stephania japonica TaxID=461633 RepID=A0AAP0PVG9_9MAGN
MSKTSLSLTVLLTIPYECVVLVCCHCCGWWTIVIGTGRGRLDGPGASSIRGGCRVLLCVTIFLPICIILLCFGDFCSGDRCNDQGMVGDSITVVRRSPDVPEHPNHSGCVEPPLCHHDQGVGDQAKSMLASHNSRSGLKQRKMTQGRWWNRDDTTACGGAAFQSPPPETAGGAQLGSPTTMGCEEEGGKGVVSTTFLPHYRLPNGWPEGGDLRPAAGIPPAWFALEGCEEGGGVEGSSPLHGPNKGGARVSPFFFGQLVSS